MNGWRPSFRVDLARKWHSRPEDWQTPLIRIRGARACNFQCTYTAMVVTFLFLLVAVSGSAGRLDEHSPGRVQLPTPRQASSTKALLRVTADSHELFLWPMSDIPKRKPQAEERLLESLLSWPRAPMAIPHSVLRYVPGPHRRLRQVYRDGKVLRYLSGYMFLFLKHVSSTGVPTFPFVAGVRDAFTASSLQNAPITSGTVSTRARQRLLRWVPR